MHPILFHLGPLPIRSYGAMTALGFLAGAMLAAWLASRHGTKRDLVLDLCAWVMAASLAGARLMYVAVQPAEYLAEPWRVFAIWQGGQVFYGGLIGGVLMAWWWMRKHRIPFWGLADAMAPGLALGQAFGRLGCFLNGCCYGRPSLHGLVFPEVGPEPRLPVQLYEAGFTLALSLALVVLHPRLRRRGGATLGLYLAVYGVFRFLVELLRGDAERGSLLGLPWLSPGQWISLAAVVAGVWMLTRKRHEGAR